jgi:hypothetical protein
MSLWLLASAVLSLCIACYLVSPFVDPVMARAAQGIENLSYGALLDSKERALRALKDLELDFAMGKISEEDFESSRHALTIEATAILDELSKHGAR